MSSFTCDNIACELRRIIAPVKYPLPSKFSSFMCDKCGKVINDTPQGYITGCEHYPVEVSKSVAKRIKSQMGIEHER